MCLSDPGRLFGPQRGPARVARRPRPARITYSCLLFSFCLNNLSKNLPKTCRLRLTRQPRVIPSFLFPFKEPLALLRGAKVGKLFRIRNNYFQGISSLFFPSSSGCPFQKGFSFEAGCKGKKHFLFHCKLFQESFFKVFRSHSVSLSPIRATLRTGLQR
ncbi:hypothetical protein ABID22_001026 [Pontibacter aydingkolensis]